VKCIKLTSDSGIIIGASSLSQLENNLAQLDKGPLPKEVVDALDDGWVAAKATTPDYWHMDLKYTYDTQAALFGDGNKDSQKDTSAKKALQSVI
jgi:aflatoxin B1 aldehyde reductase